MPFFDLRKERTKHGSVRIFDARSYDKTLSRILELRELALVDFPTLKDENAQIVQYAGDSHSRMIGLEFVAPSEIPADYVLVDAFDPT